MGCHDRPRAARQSPERRTRRDAAVPAARAGRRAGPQHRAPAGAGAPVRTRQRVRRWPGRRPARDPAHRCGGLRRRRAGTVGSGGAAGRFPRPQGRPRQPRRPRRHHPRIPAVSARLGTSGPLRGSVARRRVPGLDRPVASALAAGAGPRCRRGRVRTGSRSLACPGGATRRGLVPLPVRPSRPRVRRSGKRDLGRGFRQRPRGGGTQPARSGVVRPIRRQGG